ncbi:MAG: hypothetical protein D6748_09715 [Calditrichaeota bacterium]|nr:MAG: hypothetical protein D6748_09715 [Calditrichota bacterium]
MENDTICHFIYTGEASRVTLPCDANALKYEGSKSCHIKHSNFGYLTLTFEPDAGIEYKPATSETDWVTFCYLCFRKDKLKDALAFYGIALSGN